MPRYLDRNLLPLTRRQWADLLRQPSYTSLVDTAVAGHRVTASWVGQVEPWETPPRPFLVLVHHAAGQPRPPHEEVWCASEQEARQVHRRLVDGLQSALLCEGR